MRREIEDDIERERQRFKMTMIAAHPERADAILAIFEGDGEYAESLTDEEMDELGPLSGEQVEEAISTMRMLGLAMVVEE